MAPFTQGSRYVDAAEPPPSSMLAIHVRDGNGIPRLDHERFTQLLAESLGHDEEGNPNLNDNTEINYKLVLVVVQVGLDSLLVKYDNSPFDANHISSQKALLTKQCLDVIELVISRSPHILFKLIDVDGLLDHETPLFAYLFPRLISIAGRLEDVEIVKTVRDILSAATNSQQLLGITGCSILEQFLTNCLLGLIRAVSRHAGNSPDEEIVIEDQDFTAHSRVSIEYLTRLSASFGMYCFGQLVGAAGLLLSCLLHDNLPRHEVMRLKKQMRLLQQSIESIGNVDEVFPDIKKLRNAIETMPTAAQQPSYPFNHLQHEVWPDSNRARKRPRLSSDIDRPDNQDPAPRAGVRKHKETLKDRSPNTLTIPTSMTATEFASLNENEQCELLREFGLLICQRTGRMVGKDQQCDLCDGTAVNQELALSSDRVDELLKTILALRPIAMKRLRVKLCALEVLRRLILHTTSSSHLQLKDSPAGAWCLQSFRTVSRESKIVASRTLQAYVTGGPSRNTDVIRDNRVVAIEFLQALWLKGEPSSQESVIIALVHMAEVVEDEELNIILLRLVDYLGHRNAYITGVVYSQLQQLQERLQVNMASLLRPFWRTLSVVIIKNYGKCPETAQRLSELMGVQIDGLWQIIEEYAIPYLVLTRNRKMIELISVASSSQMPAFDICTKPHIHPQVLATLLAQDFPNAEATIMGMLCHVSDEFHEQNLAGWINLQSTQIASELLKMIGDTGTAKSNKIISGLQFMTQVISRRPIHSTASKRIDHLVVFLEANALAIVTHCTVKINQGTIRESNVEKRRCLAALGEFVRFGKSRIKIALPQISACFRAAIEEPALCNAAFSAWSVMMISLDEDEIRDLISQTFAITVRIWDHLSSKMQTQASGLIAQLMKQRHLLISEIYSDLPTLESIPALSAFEAEIVSLRKKQDERSHLTAFVSRLKDENSAVVEQALLELIPLLHLKHDFIQRSILREQPEPFVRDLTRTILDACVKFNSNNSIVALGGQGLGAIGCLDPSKSESVREKKTFVLTQNLRNVDETTAFLMFFMEQVVVKEYLSTSNLREKGFLAWSLQQLLNFCDLPTDINLRGRTAGLNPRDRHWLELSESTRLVLTPFLTSRFVSAGKRQRANISYPYFKPGMTYRHWLTEITLDLLNRSSGTNVDIIFDVCCRLVVSSQSNAIASFLLPYAALNVLLGGIEKDKQDFLTEISSVLKQSINGLDGEQQESIRQCSQSIFDILDYMSLWLQETRKNIAVAKALKDRGHRYPSLEQDMDQINLIAPIAAAVPPEIITQRAIECRSFARALFHQEQHMLTLTEITDQEYRRLQHIYAQIDEPDGIEGISSQMKFLDVESEVMEHKKAGRWTAAQSWYEMQLAQRPSDSELMLDLMNCLKESGQHEMLIHHFENATSDFKSQYSHLYPFAIEAAWSTNRWDKLDAYICQAPKGDFGTSIGDILIAIKNDDVDSAKSLTDSAFQSTGLEFTPKSTSSFQVCHDSLLKMHVLDDLRIMVDAGPNDRLSVMNSLDRRLAIIGSYVADQQYVLGIQRAVMSLMPKVFKSDDIASSWLTSARLARKAQATDQAFHAILRASTLSKTSTAIAQAKLMWQEGHLRKAIQTLEGAIDSGMLIDHGREPDREATSTTAADEADIRNKVMARALILLGKWLDQAGQTQSDTIIKTFRRATEHSRRWEKGWYNLGRHYNKILDSEKLKPPGRESQTYLTGETAKLIIDNFLRALATGNKYLFQTLPKVLTLWLELVASSNVEHDSRRGNTQFHAHNANQRKKIIEDTNASVKKYVDRIPHYAIYTILPQLVARICHPDQHVNAILQSMILKVIKSFPQQALWTVLATVKSSNKDRSSRGHALMRKAVENTKKDLKVFTLAELREFTSSSQKFSDELLRIADYEIQGRVSKVSLARDFGFNHRITPSKLVVPCEACLIPNIPANNELSSEKSFRAFSSEPITISAFLDEARVLPSLQKPRKLSLRGSDGQIYSVLAKPHDDLRKDQRLLEFDTMINRFLKRDISASKRRLYIRTYAVVPLNEECGLIEWVDGLKTMRDIILELYRQRGVQVDYAAVRAQLDLICTKSENKAKDYCDRVQSKFPPVLRLWFVQTFPDPSTWFNARLRYTRSSAVMSIVGHALGLGDRHGENILFEEGNGGVLHVDFNCLFDKGLTFEKPEMVPFRLTHNMIDAFGPYKVDGPFRKCCEITLALLRSNEDALMTILETFLHDPTTDFMTAGKKKKSNAAYVTGEVPDTPERMLEGVKGKVRGMLAGESVPLSVGGYVEEMIKRARDEANLTRMYIGWCAFL